EGRSPEQLKQLVQDVTDAITKNTGAPKEHVHIVLNEMQKDHYAVGGVLKSEEK
ncbi:MAG: 2-hydroxymuconate tautomerase, partial [Bombilactobacillus sp.]